MLSAKFYFRPALMCFICIDHTIPQNFISLGTFKVCSSEFIENDWGI